MIKLFCNQCGHPVTIKDEVCPYCGNDDIVWKHLDRTFRCSKCGHKIKSEDLFCPKCGKDVSSDKDLNQYRIKDSSTAFFLCLLFGFLGIHKFYEGRPIMGITYILTFVIFGFGWFGDLIQYLSGDYKYYLVPKGLLRGIY